ncbi:MAG: excalibur calcium-binding domain-containing protein [Micropruina sp.]|nr:excalibur calcium-binding domain-containing protein [Micropruina sp.]
MPSVGTTTVLVTPKPTVTKKVVVKKYRNCASLQKALPHGVGKPAAVDKVSRSVTPVTDFYVNAELYRLNKHLDGDGDGIACEN